MAKQEQLATPTPEILDYRLDPELQAQRRRVEHLHNERAALEATHARAAQIKAQAEVNLSACEQDLITGKCTREDLTKRRAELATATQAASDAAIELQAFDRVMQKAPASNLAREIEVIIACQRRIRAKHNELLQRLIPRLIECGKIVGELDALEFFAREQRDDFQRAYASDAPDLFAYSNGWNFANMPWQRINYSWTGSHLNCWLRDIFRDSPELLPAEERQKQAALDEATRPKPEPISIRKRMAQAVRWLTDERGRPKEAIVTQVEVDA